LQNVINNTTSSVVNMANNQNNSVSALQSVVSNQSQQLLSALGGLQSTINSELPYQKQCTLTKTSNILPGTTQVNNPKTQSAKTQTSNPTLKPTIVNNQNVLLTTSPSAGTQDQDFDLISGTITYGHTTSTQNSNQNGQSGSQITTQPISETKTWRKIKQAK